MAQTNINHAGYQTRLDAIQRILKSLSLEAASITPLEYDPNIPFAYNNFLYTLALSRPLTPSSFAAIPQRAGTTPPPDHGVSTLVIRMSNSLAEGMNTPAMRIANDVAAQYLLRKHLESTNPKLAGLLPKIYAWSSGEGEGEGSVAWCLSEFRSGEPADAHGPFEDLDQELQTNVIDTMTSIVAALQGVALPKGIPEGHVGGIKFSADGGEEEVVAAEMVILPGGPWTRYVDFWKACLEHRLEEAENNELVRGWNEGVNNAVREFIHNGALEGYLDGVDYAARSLVHGDLTTNNILIDRSTNQVTAVLDFDWACITYPLQEYVTGLDSLGSSIFGHSSSDIRPAVLKGTVDSVVINDPPKDESEIRWKTAKRMDVALREKGALRPCEMKGADRILGLQEMSRELCPGWATLPFGPREGVDQLKARGEELLMALLGSMGA